MNTNNDTPPAFKSWTTWYLLLIAVLAVLVGLFHLLTTAYA